MSDELQVELITPAQLVRRYRTQLYDFSAIARSEVERQVGKVSCHRGCAFCCYSKILVGTAEGVLMYLYLKASGQWSRALEARLVEANTAMTPVSHDDWPHRRQACVFLKEREFGLGECQVHPARPFACASTFNVGDPRNCWTPGGRHIGYVAERSSVAFALSFQSIEAGLAEGHMAMTLPGSVLYAQALIEKLPLPDVHRVDLDVLVDAERRGANADQVFDEGAAAAAASRSGGNQ